MEQRTFPSCRKSRHRQSSSTFNYEPSVLIYTQTASTFTQPAAQFFELMNKCPRTCSAFYVLNRFRACFPSRMIYPHG